MVMLYCRRRFWAFINFESAKIKMGLYMNTVEVLEALLSAYGEGALEQVGVWF